jgi:heme a synthase
MPEAPRPVRPKGAGPPPRAERRALHRFAVATAIATLFLIFAGGLVTSTESGLSVPDWPLSYGRLMPPMVGGIFYEHGHRMVATTVGILTVILAAWLARREPRAWVRRLGYGALAAVVAQGVLGGLTVIFLLPTAVSVAHACLAQTFFCLVVTIAVVTSPAWRGGELVRGNPVARIGAATVAMIFLQLLLGAVMRHTRAGLAIPDFPLSLGRVVPPLTSFAVAIHFAHRVGAVGVAVFAALSSVQAFASGRPGLKKTALLLTALVSVQIALGAWTVLSRQAVPVTTAHVATGALVLGTALTLTLASLRAGRPAVRPARLAAAKAVA